ncbi:hypothetical protein NL676_008959 [Syzygium grande]|nr:hypothetical protein NL676_008959 [Syzygium grande]
MSPNTTLFRLVHVESLNLAYNSFNLSPTPYSFSNLSRLQYLNLSNSDFSDEIPHDISQLSRLVSLDLSASWDMTLHLPNMGDLVHNLTGLKELDLYSVSLSSTIPPVLANFSSLTSLELGYCGLNGDFPVSIFQLPKLEVLDISGNSNLSGFLPKPHWGSPLKYIDLYNTNFSGEIPASIGNLSLLNELDARVCHFSGSLPSSLGNLSHLTLLLLDGNNLQGQIPVSFADLTQLSVLTLSSNNLSGDTLEWVVNLTKLTALDIAGNSFFLSAGSVGYLSFSLCNFMEPPISLAPFPTTSKTPAATATTKTRDRDFLLHLKAYLAKQDATKIILSSSLLPETLPPPSMAATRVFCRRSARGRSSSRTLGA